MNSSPHRDGSPQTLCLQIIGNSSYYLCEQLFFTSSHERKTVKIETYVMILDATSEDGTCGDYCCWCDIFVSIFRGKPVKIVNTCVLFQHKCTHIKAGNYKKLKSQRNWVRPSIGPQLRCDITLSLSILRDIAFNSWFRGTVSTMNYTHRCINIIFQPFSSLTYINLRSIFLKGLLVIPLHKNTQCFAA